MWIGLNIANTENVVIAEHDCMYTHEHLSWCPPKQDIFYYNHNCWLVQWGGNHPELNGMYSYWDKRFALSQLVCNRLLLKKSIEERLMYLNRGFNITKGLKGAGEPGVADNITMARQMAVSGQPIQLQRYLKGCLTEYKSEIFKTINSNLDIRHGTNFTGAKRGNNRTYELPYWGKFDSIIGGE
jgi:hypothetical protein